MASIQGVGNPKTRIARKLNILFLEYFKNITRLLPGYNILAFVGVRNSFTTLYTTLVSEDTVNLFNTNSV